MDSVYYQQMLETNLLPFIQQYYPNGLRLMQDNDPKQDCGWRSVTFTTRVTWHDPHRKYLGSTEAPHTSQSESAKPRRTYQWDSGILEWFDSGTVQKIHQQFVQSCAESEWKRRQCIWALNYYDHLDTKLLCLDY